MAEAGKGLARQREGKAMGPVTRSAGRVLKDPCLGSWSRMQLQRRGRGEAGRASQALMVKDIE
jgi:hypothetical protein